MNKLSKYTELFISGLIFIICLFLGGHSLYMYFYSHYESQYGIMSIFALAVLTFFAYTNSKGISNESK